MRPEAKVALVLGGIKGIGNAIGLDLLRQGVRVVSTWWDWPESLAAMQSDFAEPGTDHLIEHIDLLDTDAVGRL
ncbi:MAG: 3-oxoacyl-ACP reductase, partial [Desulfosarcina sp.]